jgi:anti-sigma B factor antagonist
MNIATRTVDGVTVAALAGDLDSEAAPAAQERVLSLAGPGARLLLDMTGVPYMSSAGLRVLLATYRQVTAGGGALVLAGLAPELAETLAETGMARYVKVAATVEDGVRQLQP